MIFVQLVYEFVKVFYRKNDPCPIAFFVGDELRLYKTCF